MNPLTSLQYPEGITEFLEDCSYPNQRFFISNPFEIEFNAISSCHPPSRSFPPPLRKKKIRLNRNIRRFTRKIKEKVDLLSLLHCLKEGSNASVSSFWQEEPGTATETSHKSSHDDFINASKLLRIDRNIVNFILFSCRKAATVQQFCWPVVHGSGDKKKDRNVKKMIDNTRFYQQSYASKAYYDEKNTHDLLYNSSAASSSSRQGMVIPFQLDYRSYDPITERDSLLLTHSLRWIPNFSFVPSIKWSDSTFRHPNIIFEEFFEKKNLFDFSGKLNCFDPKGEINLLQYYVQEVFSQVVNSPSGPTRSFHSSSSSSSSSSRSIISMKSEDHQRRPVEKSMDVYRLPSLKRFYETSLTYIPYDIPVEQVQQKILQNAYFRHLEAMIDSILQMVNHVVSSSFPVSFSDYWLLSFLFVFSFFSF
jgi:hypothetical protein